MIRRVLVLACALAAVGAAVVVPGARSGTGPIGPWAGTPTGYGGTSRYDAGEWIYTDFVYDDYGADTTPGGQPNVVSLSPTQGDFRYLDGDAFRDNAADIVEVRARVAGDDLEVRALLSTIVDPTVVALQLSTGGTDTVLTSDNAVVDPAANTVTFMVPGGAAAPSFTFGLGAGLHDGSGGLRAGVPGLATMIPDEITTGGPSDNRLFDLAFNSRELEPRGAEWNETAQSDALAAGDIGAFVQTVDIAALQAATTTPITTAPGYYVRVFESRQDLGEGMAEAFPQYRSRWQPYAVWIPDGYDPGQAAPLLLNLHSLDSAHNQYRGGASPSYTTFYEQVGDELDAVVVTPLARGPDGWYEDEGLVDTLEVWADALERFTVDRERVLVAGYSMGGYGTYRLTTMMPDAFASAAIWVGPPTNGVWAYPAPPDPSGRDDLPDNTYWQLESTRHIPTWITQGTNDELVPVAGVQHQAARYGELGHPYRFSLHPGQDHLSFVFVDEWSRETAWLAAHPRRVTSPNRVTLDIRPATWSTDADPAVLSHLRALTAEVGARLDGGYWVRDVVVAPGEDVTAVVDLTSDAIALRQTGNEAIETAGTDGPSPYVLTGNDPVFSTGPTSDRVSGSVSGVTALTIDVAAAGLSDNPRIDIESEQPVAVTLVRGSVVVRSPGSALAAPAAPAAPPAAGGTLAATGPSGVAPWVGVLVLIAGLFGLRGIRRADSRVPCRPSSSS